MVEKFRLFYQLQQWCCVHLPDSDYDCSFPHENFDIPFFLVPGTALYNSHSNTVYVVIGFMHNDTDDPKMIKHLLKQDGTVKASDENGLCRAMATLSESIKNAQSTAKAVKEHNKKLKKDDDDDKEEQQDAEQKMDTEILSQLDARTKAIYKDLVIRHRNEQRKSAKKRQKGVTMGSQRRFAEPKPQPDGYKQIGAQSFDAGAHPDTKVLFVITWSTDNACGECGSLAIL